MRGRIAIGGSVAQKAHNAGHTWQFLQYLLGFRRLGFDVLLVDTLAAADPSTHAANVDYVERTMRRHGLADAWTVDLGEGRHAGVDRAHVLRHLRESDLLLNVMGFVDDEELLAAVPCRVFLDTDPGFGQLWHELELADVFAGHDVHVTIGERIGMPGCELPTCGLPWITTPQPVVLEEWPRVLDPPRRGFTSVASWRGAYGPIDYRGTRYGLRVHEFRRFVQLPGLSGRRFELALAIDAGDAPDRARLEDAGWTLLDPAAVAATTTDYRRFVADSAAELMIAKGIYVQTRSGWVSERSICYLASGRPVLAQDTGLGERYPLGDGLLAFSTLEEAVAGVEQIATRPDLHAAAARAIAVEHFDSDRVLTRLLDAVGAQRLQHA